MAKAKSGDNMLTVNLTDEGRLSTMKTILGYEAGVRGLTVGQTFVQMVTDAVDLDSYPEEVLAQLDEIKARKSRRAIERSLQVVELEKSA